MDFPTAWKTISIALTGGFGILGLVKNFKEKRRDPETDTVVEKVTAWGWVSLIGILVSSGLGIVAQVKESASDSQKALVLAQKTDRTLDEIERMLQPIQEPTITLKFRVPCTPKYQEFCSRVAASFSKAPTHAVSCDRKEWPGDVNLRYYVNFLILNDREIELVFGQPIDFDLTYAVHGEGMKCWVAPMFGKYAILTLSNDKPRVMTSRGTMKSILDFHNVALSVSSALSNNTGDLILEECDFRFKDGQEINLFEPKTTFLRTTNERWINFRYDFPPK